MLESVVLALFDVFPDFVTIARDVAVAHDPTMTCPAEVVAQIDWLIA